MRIRPRRAIRAAMTRPRYKAGEEVELIPNAWETFERALKAAVRGTPAAPKLKPKPKRKPKAKRERA